MFWYALYLYIVKPKAMLHITRQASINARASVRYPIQTVKQLALLTSREISISNSKKRRNVIGLNQLQGM